jgi:hypothetical protein
LLPIRSDSGWDLVLIRETFLWLSRLWVEDRGHGRLGWVLASGAGGMREGGGPADGLAVTPTFCIIKLFQVRSVLGCILEKFAQEKDFSQFNLA